MSPVGAIFVLSPPKTGTNLLHPRPPPIVERVALGFKQRERGSTIEEGGDTTLSSPGRSPKQSLSEMRLHDPLYGR